MPLASALLLAVTAFASGAKPLAPPYETLPDEAVRRLIRTEDAMKKTVLGRRLFVETAHVPRLAAMTGFSGGEAVKLLRLPKPTLVFDPRRVPPGTLEWEFELAFARELSKAAMDIPLELMDAELAARQQTLEFALQKAEVDPAFARRLKPFAAAALKRLESLPEDDRALYPPPTPPGELERASFYAALFSRSPEQFYWAVERDTTWPAAMVRLAEMEDFLARRGTKLSEARLIPGTPYILAGGLRYPARFLEAAKPLLLIGGAAHAREALGQYDAAAALDLKQRLAAWLAKSP